MPIQDDTRVTTARTTRHIVLLLMLAAIAPALVSCGFDNTAEDNRDAGQPTRAPGTIVVEMVTNDMKFQPARVSAPAGATVEIVMDNPDRIKHDFTIDDFNGGRVHVEVQPRSEASFTLTMPDQSGEWRFYCSVPGHEALGMEGVLAVE